MWSFFILKRCYKNGDPLAHWCIFRPNIIIKDLKCNFSLQEKLRRGRSGSSKRSQCEVPTGGNFLLWRAANMALLPFWGRREEGWQELGFGQVRGGVRLILLCFSGWVWDKLGEKKDTQKLSYSQYHKPGLKHYSEHDMQKWSHPNQAKVNVESEYWPTYKTQNHCFPSLLLFLLVDYGKWGVYMLQ